MRFLIATTFLIATAPAALAQEHEGMMMQGPVTRAQVEANVRERFAKIDANRDGAFSKEEADGVRQTMGDNARDKHFSEMDTNKDGSISRTEFDAAHQRKGDGAMSGKTGMMRSRPGQSFDREDSNSDGKVTLAEALSHNLARFDAADANKDGILTPQERMAARQAMRGERRNRR